MILHFFSAGFLYDTEQKMETKKVVLSGASEVKRSAMKL
jgi:hypothetical protein